MSSAHSNKDHTIIKAITVLVVIACLLYYKPWLSAKQTAENAHGVTLPESAKDIDTAGDWRRGFLDRGAATIFLINTQFVGEFLSSLPAAKLYSGLGPPGPPSNGIYHRGLDVPWASEEQLSQALFLNSPIGDWLTIEAYLISEDISAIRMYTDWN